MVLLVVAPNTVQKRIEEVVQLIRVHARGQESCAQGENGHKRTKELRQHHRSCLSLASALDRLFASGSTLSDNKACPLPQSS